MTEAALDRLLRRLSEADVEFVLIGGLAVNVNGHVQTGESLLSSQPSIAGYLANGE